MTHDRDTLLGEFYNVSATWPGTLRGLPTFITQVPATPGRRLLVLPNAGGLLSCGHSVRKPSKVSGYFVPEFT
ncbi:MAG: hypothetical protein MI923_19550 [Phycisphaerales bacterium]|nr:hypothetical protein [Phycisphaerales bacterium]